MEIKYRTNIGTRLHSGTYGSILYIDTNKKIAEDPTKLFWNDIEKRLGVRTNTPSYALDISGGNFGLDNTTFSNQNGIVYKNGTRFLHDFNYGDNGTVTTAGKNVFIGEDSGNLTMGSTATAAFQSSYNTGIGSGTLFSNTTGNSNIAIGYNSLQSNTTGGNNAAIGANALDANTTGGGNSANGQSSLRNNLGGYWNTANGNDSGRYIASGGNNTNGNTSVFIGYDSRPLADSQGNQIVIGYASRGMGSNTVLIGNDSIVGTYLRGGVNVDKFSSSTVGQIIKGAASQSADLLQFKDSSDNILAEVQADGEIGIIQDSKKLYLGAGRDFSIYYDGTDSYLKTDEVAASDLKLKCGSNKTIELQDVVWDDVTVPVSAVRLAGASPADEVSYKSGMILSFDNSVDEYIYFVIQLPHRYKEGTDIKLHIHWTIPVSGAGAGIENVKWDATYSASSPTTDDSESWPTASTGTATEDVQNVNLDTHIFTDIVTMTGTNYKISETIICSLKRDTSVANNYANEAYLVSVDAHFEVNTMGSRQELGK